MTSPAPVVIVGGGIMGSACSYYLRKRGIESIIIEQCAVACHSSGKAGGFLAENWCRGETGKLAKLSFSLHNEIWKESIENGEDLGYRKLNAVEQDVGSPNTAMIDNTCMQVLPYHLTSYLSKSAKAIITETITSIDLNASSTNIEALNCKSGTSIPVGDAKVVFCLGPWSYKLTQWLPSLYKFPSKTWDAFHTSLVHSGLQQTEKEGSQAIFTEDNLEVYPRGAGTMYSCCEDKWSSAKELPDDPRDFSPSEESKKHILDSLNKLHFSEKVSSESVVKEQSCCLPQFGSAAPTIGKLQSLNAWIACGHSCWGILNGPATGKVLSEMIENNSPDSTFIDASQFTPEVHRLNA
eukprot:TRINITY_DN12745_c0_g1_i1.p1 TRINITY_DN12745_c0_g1~~TRINITY_DN12745_c0_g1_i1.p1  ORF type:complete len:352 (+),score=41.86 TRINITY_DN12745_c0_g1_i1:60-1115(+)